MCRERTGLGRCNAMVEAKRNNKPGPKGLPTVRSHGYLHNLLCCTCSEGDNDGYRSCRGSLLVSDHVLQHSPRTCPASLRSSESEIGPTCRGGGGGVTPCCPNHRRGTQIHSIERILSMKFPGFFFSHQWSSVVILPSYVQVYIDSLPVGMCQMHGQEICWS